MGPPIHRELAFRGLSGTNCVVQDSLLGLGFGTPAALNLTDRCAGVRILPPPTPSGSRRGRFYRIGLHRVPDGTRCSKRSLPSGNDRLSLYSIIIVSDVVS